MSRSDSPTVPDGPLCAACGSAATCWIELPDGRERPVCETHADDGEVISNNV